MHRGCLGQKEERPFQILGVSCAILGNRKKHDTFKKALFSLFHLAINICLFLTSVITQIFMQYYSKVELCFICNTYHSYTFTSVYVMIMFENCFIPYIPVSIVVKRGSMFIHHHISHI